MSKSTKRKKATRRVSYTEVGSVTDFAGCCGVRIMHGLDAKTVTTDEFNAVVHDVASIADTHGRYTALVAITAHTVLKDVDEDESDGSVRVPGQVREEKHLEKQGFKKLKKWRADTGSDLILWFRPPTNK